MRVSIDPVTNQFVDTPVASATMTASTARASLQEVPSPGGGTMVILRGQLGALMHASVSDGGTLHADCETAHAGARK